MDKRNAREIEFIGKITASVTHEIKNVLASIKELTGLMDDLVLMADDFPLKEKFKKTLPRILSQVERGNEITKNFNAFSHVPDNYIDTLDLAEVTRHLVFLCARFARQKNIQLIVPENNTPVEVETNPLQLYMALYCVLDFLMCRMNNDGIIKIWAEKLDEEIKVQMVFDGDLTNREKLLNELDTSEEWSDINTVINSLSSIVLFNENSNSFEITLPGTVHVDS